MALGKILLISHRGLKNYITESKKILLHSLLTVILPLVISPKVFDEVYQDFLTMRWTFLNIKPMTLAWIL